MKVVMAESSEVITRIGAPGGLAVSDGIDPLGLAGLGFRRLFFGGRFLKRWREIWSAI
jgi:hypothetical protein